MLGNKFLPGFTIVKNSAGNLTFKGSSTQLINYIAEHLQLRYHHVLMNLTVKGFWLFSHSISLEFVVENASEVAKNGQIATAIQAVARKEC